MSLIIDRIDAWRVRVPLRNPYHLSRVYGTLTHSNAVLVKVSAGEFCGWGEADPGGRRFTGDTAPEVLDGIRGGLAEALLGADLQAWVEPGAAGGPSAALPAAVAERLQGSIGAAFDVAAHDAVAQSRGQPLWQLLGERQHDSLPILWPTSSGSAEEDMASIRPWLARGFDTFMLKMGERPIDDELARLRQVLDQLPDSARLMVDANQGWSREEAAAFVEGSRGLPLVLIEQPLAADDLDGLNMLRAVATAPISVDESLQRPADAQRIIDADAADVFSVKISKNGGLRPALEIARTARAGGVKVMINSMIELGITQAAALHAGCVLDNLVDHGHAYMSTLRMADDVTDFSAWCHDGRAHLPAGRAGLGVRIDEAKIATYTQDEYHVAGR